MAVFKCKIGTSDGRIVEREFTAESKPQLLADLESQGFHVFVIRRAGIGSLVGQGKKGRRLKSSRFVSFNQELLVLLRSGLPILQVFDTQIEQMEAGSFRDALTQIREEIRGGKNLSESFSQFPHIFPPLYIAALKAGEKTGDVPETLSRFLAYQKRIEAIRGRVKGASFYPLILTVAAISVVVFLMLFVVPRFTEIYADAHVELPLMTRILIGLSSLVVDYWYLLPICVFALFLGLRTLLRSSKGRLWLDRQLLRVVFFGTLLRDYGLSSFARTLGTTLTSGTPLIEAMKMSRGTLNNLSMEQQMIKAIQQVEEGGQLSEALRQTGYFPALALRMISVGETAGTLVDMLADLAEYYEGQIDTRLSQLTTLIEPIMMMTMGLLIAFIIVAMYVPIFQLAATVG